MSFRAVIAKILCFLVALQVTAEVSAFSSLFEEEYKETMNGYTVRIFAEVNGVRRLESHVMVAQTDAVILRAELLHRGTVIPLEKLRVTHDLTFWWYKITPSNRVFLDSRSLNQFSKESEFFYRYLSPGIPSRLSYGSSEVSSDNTEAFTPDFSQNAIEKYSDATGKTVGTLRWKAVVLFEPKTDGEAFYVTSPGEDRLAGEFDKFDFKKAREVLLLARRGGTGHRAYDEALSYLGLPYIWWGGPVSSRLGLTCSQLVSTAAFGKVLSTDLLHAKEGIRIVGIENGRFKGRVDGKTVFLEYGKHVNPGSVIVYYNGRSDRHTAMIGDDLGTTPGFLDIEDKMIHSAMGGFIGGNIGATGIEYVSLGKEFNAESLKFGMKIIAVPH